MPRDGAIIFDDLIGKLGRRRWFGFSRDAVYSETVQIASRLGLKLFCIFQARSS